MERSEIEARVKKVVSNILKVDESAVKSDANFVFDLGADSQQSIELVAAFEEEFEIEMDEEKALQVQTVSDAVNFISTYVE